MKNPESCFFITGAEAQRKIWRRQSKVGCWLQAYLKSARQDKRQHSMNLGALVSPMVLLAASRLVAAPEQSAANYELKRISLPGASGAVALDYFAYDRVTGKLCVAASNTGSVDVIDGKTDAVSQITGFPTGEIERRGRKITVGPTAASIGDGVVYIGDRGNGTLCVVDAKTFTRGECVPTSPDRGVTPDGVLYIAATRELWITTRPTPGADPGAAKSLQVFDASDP